MNFKFPLFFCLFWSLLAQAQYVNRTYESITDYAKKVDQWVESAELMQVKYRGGSGCSGAFLAYYRGEELVAIVKMDKAKRTSTTRRFYYSQGELLKVEQEELSEAKGKKRKASHAFTQVIFTWTTYMNKVVDQRKYSAAVDAQVVEALTNYSQCLQAKTDEKKR